MNFSKLILLAVLVSSSAIASDSKLTCPISVKATTPLIVTATLKNDDCNSSFAISNLLTSVVGNSGGTLGLQGPFVMAPPGGVLSIPKANCTNIPFDQVCGLACGSFFNIDEGKITIPNIQVISKVPASMIGSIIVVNVAAEDTNSVPNKIKAGKPCSIHVVK